MGVIREALHELELALPPHPLAPGNELADAADQKAHEVPAIRLGADEALRERLKGTRIAGTPAGIRGRLRLVRARIEEQHRRGADVQSEGEALRPHIEVVDG